MVLGAAAPIDRGVMVGVRGVHIAVGVASRFERYRIDTIQSKEPDTLDWIDRHLTPYDTLYDVGANIGLFSLYAALKSPHSTVYAFEPVSHNFSRLCQNILRNRLTNVVAANIALSSDVHVESIYLSGLTDGGSMHSVGVPSHVTDFGERIVLRHLAMVTSIDHFTEECGVRQPTMIKLDVDGTEQTVLIGATRVLGSRHVKTMLIERNWTSCPDDNEFINGIGKYGYELVARGIDYQLGHMHWRNYVFDRR